MAMTKHLVITFRQVDENKWEAVATGDTYGAKEVLKRHGWQFRKNFAAPGGEWYLQGKPEEINLMHLTELQPDDVEYLRQWSVEIHFPGGKEAVMLINAGKLIPAKWERGKVVRA